MDYTKEQIADRYERLPDDVKRAMDSVDTTNALVDIGQKHDLLYDQISDLVNEVGLVLLGLLPSQRFVSETARRLHIDTAKSLAIAHDVNEQVFDKMRKSMQKIEADNEKRMSEEGTAKPVEEIAPTAEERAAQASVASAVEKAGGFVIDKPEQTAPEKTEPKEAILGAIEKESYEEDASPTRNVESSLAPDHLLGTENEAIKPVAKPLDQSSIVDTLLSKGVAMPLDAPSAQKPMAKTKPYDGADPYREPAN